MVILKIPLIHNAQILHIPEEDFRVAGKAFIFVAHGKRNFRHPHDAAAPGHKTKIPRCYFVV
jgi:hypothetical protein